jgi:hypothetical protein
MTTIEEIWTYIDTNEPFTVHLSDGRKLFVPDSHWVGAHPSRKGTAIRIFGPGEDEEHVVPLRAVTSVSKGENGQHGDKTEC